MNRAQNPLGLQRIIKSHIHFSTTTRDGTCILRLSNKLLLFINLLQQDNILLTYQHKNQQSPSQPPKKLLDLPLTASTGPDDRVDAEPLDTLLSEHIPPPIPGSVQTVSTHFTVRLLTARALSAGFELVVPVG